MEEISIGYDGATGLPVRLNTNRIMETGTMAATWYTPYGENSLTTVKMPNGTFVDTSITREEGTRRISRATVKPETAAGTVTDRAYTYDDAGNITAIVDASEVGATDQQCFRYDKLARLSTAWTPRVGIGCDTDPAVANLATGSQAYWQDWTFDDIGNRINQTNHTTAGETATTYAVPPSGPEAVHPHALTGTSTTMPGQSPLVQQYAYDQSGNTTCRPASSGTNDCTTDSGSQVLHWDAEGRLAAVETGDTTIEANIYDADGVRLIRRDATGATLYLPGQEIRYEAGTTTAIRYYTFAGSAIASRTPSGLTWLFADHQGTQQTAVAENTQAVTIRRQTPGGAIRGDNPTWPNGKGFVGGDTDPTGLTHLGAREYDPDIGRFISVDPVMDLADPQQWNAYAYANNNPTTLSDPDGLIPADCREFDCYGYSPTAGCPGGCGTKKNIDWGRANKMSSTKTKYRSTGFSNRYGPNGSVLTTYDDGTTSINGLRVPKGGPDSYKLFLYTDKFVTRYRDPGSTNWDYGTAAGIYEACRSGIFDCTKEFKEAALELFAKSQLVPLMVDGLVGEIRGTTGLRRTPTKLCSFAGATEVLMADGTTKPIDKVEVGDEVMATDPETEEQGPRKISAIWVHDDKLFDLVTDGGVIFTTEDHAFWNATDRQWQRVDLLTPGDSLHGAEAQHARVIGLRQGPVLPNKAYNLTVDDIHTYYVIAGTVPVLVHNDGGYTTPGNNSYLTVDEALDAGLKWLGDGYTEPVPGSGRFVSRDGTRVFRMGDSDILGRHGGGPHTNFERMEVDPKTGRMKVVQNDHVYFKGGAC